MNMVEFVRDLACFLCCCMAVNLLEAVVSVICAKFGIVKGHAAATCRRMERPALHSWMAGQGWRPLPWGPLLCRLQGSSRTGGRALSCPPSCRTWMPSAPAWPPSSWPTSPPMPSMLGPLMSLSVRPVPLLFCHQTWEPGQLICSMLGPLTFNSVPPVPLLLCLVIEHLCLQLLVGQRILTLTSLHLTRA